MVRPQCRNRRLAFIEWPLLCLAFLAIAGVQPIAAQTQRTCQASGSIQVYPSTGSICETAILHDRMLDISYYFTNASSTVPPPAPTQVSAVLTGVTSATLSCPDSGCVPQNTDATFIPVGASGCVDKAPGVDTCSSGGPGLVNITMTTGPTGGVTLPPGQQVFLATIRVQFTGNPPACEPRFTRADTGLNDLKTNDAQCLAVQSGGGTGSSSFQVTQCIPGTVCRESAGQCDVPEICTSDGTCPDDGFQPSTTSCTGTQNGLPCDATDSCDGAGHCVDGYKPATTTCRDAVGECDVAESCTGGSGECPPDGFKPSTTSCTGTQNGLPCDATDSCDGQGHCVDGYKPATTTCRDAVGECDVAESCTGGSGECPPDGFKPSTTSCTGTQNGLPCDATDSCDGAGHCVDGYKPATTTCRDAVGECDVAESCTGGSGECPPDGFKPSTTSCTGTQNGLPCDATDSCDGAGHCVDGYKPATTTCRDAVGECDVAESCTGGSGECPPDGFKPSTTSCTGTQNGLPCDATDSCDGQGHCVDGYKPATTTCRDAVGECDVAESCTGGSGECPPDGFKPSTTSCTGTQNGLPCDATDSCDGQGHCVDGYKPATTICRESTGQCDVEESCTGGSGECPPDGFKPSTTSCTGTQNGLPCDATDSCDGQGHCVDGYKPATTTCRDAVGECDVAESCTGGSGECPPDGFKPSTTSCTGTQNGLPCDATDSCDGQGHCLEGYKPATTTCRDAVGECDVAESCTGGSGECPPDGFKPSTTSCTGTQNGLPCDATDSCDGAGHCLEGYKPATTTCRDAVGQCDVAESCTGGSGACPPDGFKPSTTSCTGTQNGLPCDATDSCDGAGHCLEGYKPATTTCRDAVGQCDVAESCTGGSGACPPDGFKPSTTSCTGTQNGLPCDATDSCDGAGHCLEGYKPATTTCRDAVGECDVAESCTGGSGECPPDGFKPSTTSCTGTQNGLPCDATDSCDGQGHCLEGYKPATTTCRDAVGQCDVAESCTGGSGACPPDGFKPSTTSCTGTQNGLPCDATDSCDGAGHCLEGYKPATTTCRDAVGQCDVAESCTGGSGACPPDGFKPSTTSCTGTQNGLPCDATDSCDGQNHCVDGYYPATTICRPAASNCDVAESCPGSSGTCPPDDGTAGNGTCEPIGECMVPYPFASSNPNTSLVFSESEVLRAFTATVDDGCLPQQIRLYYNDEHALTLGVRRVIVKTGSGTTTTDYPVSPLLSNPGSVFNPLVGTTVTSGDQAGTDVSGRPMWPALFITDTTSDPDSLDGDWQYGGTPIAPHAVFGTWKAAVRTVDYTHTPALVTVTPDVDPAKNDWNLDGGDPAPAGLTNQGYGAEARWDATQLGLIPGHTYRFYFMVHDGDQNKTGGDVGHGCTNVLTAPVCPGPCQSNADCDDHEICTTDTCVDGVCSNTIPPGSTCLCADGDCPELGHAALVTTSVDGNGDVTAVFTESTEINDNSYGTNAVNWPGGHSFGNLTGSDKANFVFRDANGNVVFDFLLDYISTKGGTPSGYGSLGATGGDGSVNSGSAAWLLDYQTSESANLNNTGYCTAGNCTVSGVNLLVNSPPTIPSTSYNVPAAFNQWNFNIQYTVKISHLAFGAAGFGSVSVPSVHNSPPKCGDNAANFDVCPCSGTIGNFVWNDLDLDGIQDVGEPGIGGIGLTLKDGNGQTVATTTTDANGFYEFTGLCPASYTVVVDSSTVPSYLVPTLCNAGGDDTKDNDCSPASVTLTPNQPSDASIDFGYRGRPCESSSVCTDGNVCNGSETCVNSVCQPGTPLNCDDGVSCTTDSCNPATGCVNTSTVGAASISSSFNGTAIPAGRTIWFNANFKAKGITAGITTVRWQSSTITFKVGAQTFTLPVPDGQIVFNSATTCATTTFNVGLNRWETNVPVSGSDEIFLSGLAFLVPYNFPGGIKPVTWTGNFTVDKPNVELTWKWGAAVYTTSMSDYNALGVKPMHTNSCLYANSDHAGTPENKKSFVVGGARGGGGSNYTGSWSGTQTKKINCVIPQLVNSGAVVGVAFSADKQQITWSAAQDAMSYDVLSGDVMDLRAAGGVGAAFCADDDLVTTLTVEDLVPEPGHCIFYVIRGDAVSDAAGTYDTVAPAPAGSERRDLEAGTVGVDCTHKQQ